MEIISSIFKAKISKKNLECWAHHKVPLGLKWFKSHEQQIKLMFAYDFTHSNNKMNSVLP